MSRNVIETVMGAVVLAIAGGFLYTAYQSRSLSAVKDGMHVTARFGDVSGIDNGSDVRIGGVKIGVVDSLTIDRKSYQAELRLLLRGDVALPADTTASIVADGLLGSKFVALEPGGDEETLGDGGVIAYTQSSVNIEQLIGRFIFGKADDGDDAGDGKNDAPKREEDGDLPSL